MYSEGGQGFVVLHSTTSSGDSRIVPQLAAGDVVTTPKNTVDKVVTEWGVAELRGRSIRERTRNLIAIAHPDHRDELTAARPLDRLPLTHRRVGCRAGPGPAIEREATCVILPTVGRISSGSSAGSEPDVGDRRDRRSRRARPDDLPVVVEEPCRLRLAVLGPVGDRVADLAESTQ